MIAHVQARYEQRCPHTPGAPGPGSRGAEVTVSMEEAPPQANGKETILEMFERLRQSVPPDEWEKTSPPTWRRTTSITCTATPRKKTNGERSLRTTGYWIAVLEFTDDHLHGRATGPMAASLRRDQPVSHNADGIGRGVQPCFAYEGRAAPGNSAVQMVLEDLDAQPQRRNCPADGCAVPGRRRTVCIPRAISDGASRTARASSSWRSAASPRRWPTTATSSRRALPPC